MKKSTRNANRLDPIDLKVVFTYILKDWYLFPIFITTLLGFAYLYLNIVPPKYEINSSIVIKEGEKETNFSNNAIFDDLENIRTSVKLADELEKLKSKSLIWEVLMNLNTFVKYVEVNGIFPKEIDPFDSPVKLIVHEFNNSFKDHIEELKINVIDDEKFEITINKNQKTELGYGEIIKISYGTVSIEKNWNSINSQEELKTFKIILNNKNLVTEKYLRDIKVESAGLKSSTVYLRLQDSSPERGIQILDGIVKAYNDRSEELKNEVAIRTIKFIDERLAHLKKVLEEAEKNIEFYKVHKGITDIALDSRINLENQADANKQLLDLVNKLEILSLIQKKMNDDFNKYEFIPNAIGGVDPLLLEMLSSYNAFQSELQKILQTVPPTHPQSLSLKEQITSLRRSILENAKNNKQNLEITKKNLEESLSISSVKVQQLPAIERELIELNRQKATYEENYQYLMMKRAESVLALEITGNNSAQIIDSASSSLNPVNPTTRSVFGGAFAMGIIFPLVFIFSRYKLSSKVTSRTSVEKMLCSQILGEVANNDHKGEIAICKTSLSPTSEQLRLIRSNLKFLTKREDKVIVVSSSMSKEGKTFICINLATTLSRADKKVVIVDFDLRRPEIFKTLNIKNQNCMKDYLTRKITDWRQLIVPSGVSGYLDVIGINENVLSPDQDINFSRAFELIEHLKSEYEYIIIDTSPIGLVADAYALSEIADLMIFVIRMNFTRIFQLDQIKEIIENKFFRQNFLILNDTPKTTSMQFGYGYYGAEEKKERIA